MFVVVRLYRPSPFVPPPSRTVARTRERRPLRGAHTRMHAAVVTATIHQRAKQVTGAATAAVVMYSGGARVRHRQLSTESCSHRCPITSLLWREGGGGPARRNRGPFFTTLLLRAYTNFVRLFIIVFFFFAQFEGYTKQPSDALLWSRGKIVRRFHFRFAFIFSS